MSAAKVLDSQAVNVHLIEKADHLGGNAFDWACMATDKCQYCGACLTQELVEQVDKMANTTLYKGCRINSLEKKDDGYHVSIKGSTEAELDVDAVILATGFNLFDPDSLQFFEYNEKGVITTAELNRVLKDERLPEILNKNKSPSIAFIQCVGSRNREIGNDYCSQVCCKTAVRFTNKISHIIPDASITIFHMDLQTCGKMFRTQVSQLGDNVKLVQGVPGKVLSVEGDKLRLFQENTETGARSSSDFDMVVLTVGMESVKDNNDITGSLELNPDKWGFFSRSPEAAVKNVYSTGTVNGPMDILTAMEQGVSVAHEVLHDLDADMAARKYIAVLGYGKEGRSISKSMAEAGHFVSLFEDNNGSEAPEGVELFSNSRITDISGTAGRFTVKANSDNTSIKIDVSAIILATGTDKETLSDENLPDSSNIISLADFTNQPQEDINKKYNNAVFWLDHAGQEWKSNAKEILISSIKLSEAGKSVSVIMEKMLVNGINTQKLYDSARNRGVKFLRTSASSDVAIKKAGNSLMIEVKEATLAGVTVDVPCDLLIIPEQVKCRPENSCIAELINQKTDGEGFLQSPNTRHRRVSSTRKGIFYTGSCHDETDNNDLEHEVKTINALINLMPREKAVEGTCADIDEGKCGKCLTCFRVCPHGAIILETENQPVVMGDACFSCGLCAAFCPAVAISIKGQVIEDTKENNRDGTVIFACKRSGLLAEKAVDVKSGYEIIPIDCACSLDSKEIIKQYAAGAERIMVFSCHSDNCRSIHGDTSARLQINKVYEDTGIPKSMLSLHSIAANEPVKFKKLIEGTTSINKENSDE